MQNGNGGTMNFLFLFNEQFDAMEFIDRVNFEDIVDHFPLTEESKLINPDNMFQIQGNSTPYTVILSSYIKYEPIIKSFRSGIIEIEEIKNFI